MHKIEWYSIVIISTIKAASLKKTNEVNLSSLDKISAFLDASPETKTVTMNEADYIESIQNISEEELHNSGYSKKEVKEIKNVDYKEQLLELSRKDKKELKEMGYSEQRIKAFQAYDGTTDAVSYLKETRAGGTVTFK